MILNTAFDDFVVGEIVGLMANSEFHKTYSPADIDRLITPAVHFERARCYFDADTEDLVGFMTWTFLTPEAEKGYLDGSRSLQPEDWMTGPDDGQLWIIDMVAAYGGVKEMVRSTKASIDIQYQGQCRKAFFKRTLKGNRIGHISSSVTVH